MERQNDVTKSVMERQLNKHTSLVKKIQLELKVTDTRHDIVIYHQRLGYFPMIKLFALFMPGKTTWHNFSGARKIVEGIRFHDGTDYEIYIHPTQPGDRPTFKRDWAPETVIKSSEDTKRYIRRLLKAYQQYAAIEYEA